MSLTSINLNNTIVTGVDDGPTAGSQNLVKSMGAYNWIVNPIEDENNKADKSIFLNKKSFNSETGEIDDNENSIITGRQHVTPGDIIVFSNIYGYFENILYMWDTNGNYIGREDEINPNTPYTVPQGVGYIGRIGGYGTGSYEYFVKGSYMIVNDIFCEFQRKQVEKCALDLGLTPHLVENMIFYTETNGKDLVGDNILSKYFTFRNGHIDGVNWGLGRYAFFTELPYFIGMNTELDWTHDICYDNLKDFDFEHIFVKYNPTSPNVISKIAIFKTGIVFTDEEWDILHKAFDLPIFRNNIFNENGEWKDNRSFFKSEYLQLINSPNFTDPSAWALDNTNVWSIHDNAAYCNDTLPTLASMKQIINDFEVGYKYRLVFKIKDYVSGSIQVRIDWDTFESAFVIGNNFVELEFIYKTSIHPKTLSFRPGENGFVGAIDFVELVKID